MTGERIGFLTFGQMCGRQNMGSTRIRALNVIAHWPEAEVFRIGQCYSAIVFQKAYWVSYAKAFKGLKILDLCDPDLLQWDSPCKAMADACDIVTTSTQPLAKLVSKYTATPVFCIPDRVNLESLHNLRKDHVGNGPARTACWFGYSSNFLSLDSAIPHLLQAGIRQLIVIADPDRPYWLPLEFYDELRVINYHWKIETVYRQLLEADLVLNFRVDTGRWKYKSNNKTTLAWALGLPVAHCGNELAALISEESRVREAEKQYKEVVQTYDVRESVAQYKSLIARANDYPGPNILSNEDSQSGRPEFSQ
jgi:hypothetical protein